MTKEMLVDLHLMVSSYDDWRDWFGNGFSELESDEISGLFRGIRIQLELFSEKYSHRLKDE